MEKPRTEEVGRVFGALYADSDVPAGRKRDAHDFGGAFDIAAEVEVGSAARTVTDCSTRVVFSSQVNGATSSTCGDCGGTDDDLSLLGEVVMEKEVFVDRGELGMGVPGAVEQPGVVSVAADDKTSV